jgi:hypothetical protein
MGSIRPHAYSGDYLKCTSPFFSNFVFFNFYFGTVFFNEAPSEGFNDEAEPVYVNTYINTHKYMLRVSL